RARRGLWERAVADEAAQPWQHRRRIAERTEAAHAIAALGRGIDQQRAVEVEAACPAPYQLEAQRGAQISELPAVAARRVVVEADAGGPHQPAGLERVMGVDRAARHAGHHVEVGARVAREERRTAEDGEPLTARAVDERA